jgi:hypothetical protein
MTMDQRDDLAIDDLVGNIIGIVEDIIIEDFLLDPQIYMERKRMRTGLPGHDYTHELLGSENDERVHQVLRMTHSTFIALRDWLLANTLLKSARAVTVEEKLAIFLYIVSRPASNRDAQERFSHSGDTISR